jgi:uncharacterized cupredoxin-like copper-binding protein
MKKILLSVTSLIIVLFYAVTNTLGNTNQQQPATASTKINRTYVLEATMLGYIAKDGTRNPVLKARKGERVRITIVNGELMTHDIALEKMKIKSKVLVEKGSTTSITFVAKESDTYFCSIPGHRAAGMVGKFEVTDKADAKVVASVGSLPVSNGKPLNLNFESGTLKDWTATGDAFESPLIAQNPSPKHEKDSRISKEGKYFVSSGGNKEHEKTGTLTSSKFKVTQPYAAFKVSGGALHDTRVEILSAADDSVIFQTPGTGRATLRPDCGIFVSGSV